MEMEKLKKLIDHWKCRENVCKTKSISIEESTLISQVLDILNNLEENLIKLDELAQQNDYNEHLKYNGFRSIIKINSTALNLVFDLLASESSKEKLSKKKVEKNLFLIKYVNRINSITLENWQKNKKLFKNDENQNRVSKDYEIVLDKQLTNGLVEQFFAIEQDSDSYLDGFLSFHLTSNLRLLNTVVSNFFLLISNLPHSLFIHLSKTTKVETLKNLVYDPTITWPASIEVANKPYIFPLINLIGNMFKGSKAQTIYLPRQKKWLLKSLDECESSDTGFLFNYQAEHQSVKCENFKKNSIRTRFIYHNSRPKDGVVMLHMHGGAFIYHSPDCHEGYLQKIVQRLPNLYILSVDYKLAAKFGAAHQDCLDVYLWLTSDSPDVVELFGFKPKRILIAGDSAGAFLAFNIVQMCKDLHAYVNEQKLDETIVVPDTLIQFYGFTTLNKISPSFHMTFIDTIVSLLTIRTGFGSLVFGGDETCDKQVWYASKNPKREQYTKEFIEKAENHPYLDPLHHVDFEEFKDVQLYLVTCEFDPFLDVNIELAKKWKGFVDLKVCDDTCHGFLQLSVLDSKANEALMKSIDVIEDAISRQMALLK